jgi:beta-N-acetylhexosaminidase
VQRFRHGFTVLPPMRTLGTLWDIDPQRALEAAAAAGYVLAAELRACGIDLSFTPVLDLDYGTSEIIGNRALHSDPAAVTALATALITGLRRAGMASVGKHFPGHGFVVADSHVAIPVDTRPAQALYPDLAPYRDHRRMDLAAVMPAHVIYENLDPHPAGFSSYWLRYVLRGELGFDGVIFSDDLSMEGASIAGGFVERADAALAAGCDMVLVCNNPTQRGIAAAGMATAIRSGFCTTPAGTAACHSRAIDGAVAGRIRLSACIGSALEAVGE